MVERFGASDAPELQVDIATALFNKGVAQRQRGENAAALTAYDELIERFGESAIPELQKAVASCASRIPNSLAASRLEAPLRGA